MDPEHVGYEKGAKVRDAVAPEDLPSRRVDDAPRAGAKREKGGGEGVRNVSAASPRDAALEP